MTTAIVNKDYQYVLKHCTKYLSRDNRDSRHDYFDRAPTDPRTAISEAWRFPLVDEHDPEGATDLASLGYAAFNDVTFILAEDRDGPPLGSVEVVSTCTSLIEPMVSRDRTRFRSRSRARTASGGCRHCLSSCRLS